jgi:hypothetical protein
MFDLEKFYWQWYEYKYLYTCTTIQRDMKRQILSACSNLLLNPSLSEVLITKTIVRIMFQK